MSGIEVIAAALAAGALTGANAAASETVRDAYTTLRRLIRKRLADSPQAQRALDSDDVHDEGWWIETIGADLSQTQADQDEEVLQLALSLLREHDEHKAGAKYEVKVDRSRGVVVGDETTNTFTFYD